MNLLSVSCRPPQRHARLKLSSNPVMELWTSGGTGRNPRENRHLCAISPSTLHGRTFVRDETATTTALSLSYSCPSRGNLLSKECTPASAFSPATTSRGAITRARLPNLSAQKTPAANATSAFDFNQGTCCRSPTAYSPNAFFSALTRLRLTGIFSSTPFSVSSSVPPETDSISSTMERFTRYPRCTRKNPWPSKRFSS